VPWSYNILQIQNYILIQGVTENAFIATKLPQQYGLCFVAKLSNKVIGYYKFVYVKLNDFCAVDDVDLQAGDIVHAVTSCMTVSK